MSTFPWNSGDSLSYATTLSKSSHKNTDPQQSTGVCPKTKGAEREKRILFSPSVVAKGTRSAFLCCDWIIILLLIRVVLCFLSGLSSERQGAPCHPAGQHKSHESFPKEPRRTSGGGWRASHQIQGDATATGYAGQSHMAPGQTGRKAITYSLLSHLPFCFFFIFFLSIPPSCSRIAAAPLQCSEGDSEKDRN